MNQQGAGRKVGFGEDRFGDAARFLNGRFDCKVSAADTHGGMSVFDTFRDVPGGPPLHYHELQDEWFMVLEGSFSFRSPTKGSAPDPEIRSSVPAWCHMRSGARRGRPAC